MATNEQIQARLNELGFGPLQVDGVIGPATDAAIMKFKKSVGLVARPYIGPVTLGKLFGNGDIRAVEPVVTGILPWDNELKKHIGWHEVGNNAALRAWLKSDGSTLGDPSKSPWCGDAMETAIRLGLPDEWARTDARLRANPYWALNWEFFGESSPLRYGAICSFKRKGGGHIAEAIGIDPKRGLLRVRGGNQSNTVSDTWIDKARLHSCRKPVTWSHDLPPLPVMNSAGKIVSTNEA